MPDIAWTFKICTLCWKINYWLQICFTTALFYFYCSYMFLGKWLFTKHNSQQTYIFNEMLQWSVQMHLWHLFELRDSLPLGLAVSQCSTWGVARGVRWCRPMTSLTPPCCSRLLVKAHSWYTHVLEKCRAFFLQSSLSDSEIYFSSASSCNFLSLRECNIFPS